MEFNSTAYLEVALKMYIYDHRSEPEIARNKFDKAINDAIEFTFPANGNGELWRRKFLRK